jgi:hypothetical protein
MVKPQVAARDKPATPHTVMHRTVMYVAHRIHMIATSAASVKTEIPDVTRATVGKVSGDANFPA